MKTLLGIVIGTLITLGFCALMIYLTLNAVLDGAFHAVGG